MSTVQKRKRIQTQDSPDKLDTTTNTSENNSTQLSELPSISPTSDQNNTQVQPNPIPIDSNSTNPDSSSTAPRKRKMKVSIGQTSSSPENSQSSAPTPNKNSSSSYEVITDDIPILTDSDLDQYLDQATVNKGKASKAYRRSNDASLIMFQHEGDKEEEEEEDFVDIPQLTPSEARMFLTKAHSTAKKEEMARSMEKQEKAFFDSFSQDQTKNHKSFEKNLKEQELKRVLDETRHVILSKGKYFDPKTAQLDYSQIENPPVLFQPTKRGFGHLISQSASRGINNLATPKKEFDLKMAKRLLNLQNVHISDDPTRIPYQDPFDKLTKLYNQLKGESSTLKSIDLASRQVYELISCFSQIIITSSRYPVSQLLNDLSDAIGNISSGVRKLLSVQTALIHGIDQAKSKEIKSKSWHLATYVCAYLIQKGELSDLFRGLAKLSSWKLQHYFNDSIIFSYDLCCHVASIAESVQCADIFGEFPIKVIDNFDTLPPMTAKAWAARIRGLSRDYMNILRVLMMKSYTSRELCIDPFISVVEQALICLLQRGDGVIMKYDLLWTLFQAAANSVGINKFQEAETFKKIVKEAKGKSPLSKALYVVAETINQGFFYLIPLFAYAGQKTANNFESVTILMSEVDCLQIAMSLEMIKDPNINVTADDIQLYIQSKK